MQAFGRTGRASGARSIHMSSPRLSTSIASGRIVVGVHQVVNDRAGKLLLDRMVEHIYTIEDGLIRSMDIRE